MTPEQQEALRRAQQRLALDRARERVTEGTPSRPISAIQQAAHGLTFGGIDEMAGVVGGLMRAPGEGTFAEGYAETRDKARGELAAGREAYPVQSATSEIGGGLLTPASSVGTLGKGASALQRLIMGALGGAGYGGLYGFGTGEGGVGERLDNAQSVGGWGAVAGAAAPVVAGGVQKVANSGAANAAAKQLAKVGRTRDLRGMAAQAGREIEGSNVTVTPQAFSKLQGNIQQAMDPTFDYVPYGKSSTPRSAKLMGTMSQMSDDMAQAGAVGLPYKSLRSVRQRASDAAGNITKRQDVASGMAAKKAIDSFIENLSPSDLAGGDPQTLKSAVRKMNEIWPLVRKTQLLDEAVGDADLYLGGTASGVRNKIKSLLTNKATRNQWTDAERKVLGKVINGPFSERLITLLGGGMGTLGQVGTSSMVGAGAGGPLGAIAGAAVGGALADTTHKAANSIARRNIEAARNLVASGQIPTQLPEASPIYRLLTERLMRQGTAAAASR